MSRNIRGLRDLQSGGGHDSGADSDGEDGRQGFFVGGSEHSGQQVLGPSGRDGDDLAARVFQSASRHGAEAVSADDATSRSRRPATTGRGVRLNGNPEPAVRVSDGEATEGPVRVTLYMYPNGFSIDDGPLRMLNDPESEQFIQDIMQGRIPRELLQLHRGRQIDLHMERKLTPYEPPKMKPFQGSGARLGNVVPTVVGAGSSSAAPEPAAPQSTPDEAAKNLEKAKEEVKLEAGQPTTNVQIRLPSGQRLVGTFNHTHTVTTVRSFICSAYPEMEYAPFQLMTTFPNKVIDDESLSLKDANLLNAVVVVKQQSV
ncbi:unnamed protein product [Caenorhabditis auriculariae]|uniref:UBX domain-containing protein n=1 Tax=Caenorhabditis auriculariae TaxID=2777116 RepID=A0A8S1HI20_9PELO|nr:unnamed protein product [Caenorhabditis auriculariae]